MKIITVRIGYLTDVEVETGKAAKHGDGRYVNGRFFPRAVTRAVEPTIVDVSVTDDRIATIHATWGDRVDRGKTPGTYGELVDGTKYDTPGGRLRLDGYESTDDVLLAAILDARRQIAAAWLADLAARADVAAVVENYRATVLDALDREYAEHHKRWEADRASIAAIFRRKWVEIGEQTVPGKCCVRSSRGKLLGYADVWDGKWLGTVER